MSELSEVGDGPTPEMMVEHLDGQVQTLLRENEGLRRERDLWKARAFAMFWKLPGDMTIGQLQDDADRALKMVQCS